MRQWSVKQLRGVFAWRGVGRERTHAWERWTWAWDAIFCAVLVLALVSSLGDLGLYGRRQLAMVLLSAAWGGWYWFMVVRHKRWVQCTRPMLVYMAGAVTLAFTLIWLHPAYQMLNFVLYMQIFTFLPMRRAIPASIILTGLHVAYGIWREPGQTPVWLISGVFTLGVGLFFALWIDSIINQSQDRQRLIDELEETRADLASAEREAGTLEERQRLAREIHDTLAQNFVGIVTQLEAADRTLDPDQEDARLQLDRARRMAREGLSESRRLVRALRPELLEGASLPEALSRLTARWSETTGASAGSTVSGTPYPLPMQTEVTLLRAAQEALSNARKHAHASTVDTTLSYMDDLVVLDVQDDGAGFDASQGRPDADGGFGLRSMRERVEGLGGRLLVESAPGEGTTLVVEVPRGVSGIRQQASGKVPEQSLPRVDKT